MISSTRDSWQLEADSNLPWIIVCINEVTVKAKKPEDRQALADVTSLLKDFNHVKPCPHECADLVRTKTDWLEKTLKLRRYAIAHDYELPENWDEGYDPYPEEETRCGWAEENWGSQTGPVNMKVNNTRKDMEVKFSFVTRSALEKAPVPIVEGIAKRYPQLEFDYVFDLCRLEGTEEQTFYKEARMHMKGRLVYRKPMAPKYPGAIREHTSGI